MIDIDTGNGEIAALAITGEIRMEAWEISIAQASNGEQLTMLEARLFRRLELLRTREHSPDIERTALALIAERRNQIAAEAMGNAAWP